MCSSSSSIKHRRQLGCKCGFLIALASNRDCVTFLSYLAVVPTPSPASALPPADPFVSGPSTCAGYQPRTRKQTQSLPIVVRTWVPWHSMTHFVFSRLIRPWWTALLALWGNLCDDAARFGYLLTMIGGDALSLSSLFRSSRFQACRLLAIRSLPSFPVTPRGTRSTDQKAKRRC